jgi:hypothetical protein
VDVRVAASVGVAQRRQCLVTTAAAVSAQRCSRLDGSALLGSSTVAVVCSPYRRGGGLAGVWRSRW